MTEPTPSGASTEPPRLARIPRTAEQIHAAALGHPQQIGAPGCACDIRAADERRAYVEEAKARAGAASTEATPPLDPALIERLYRALAHDRDDDTGDAWLHRDDADALHAFLGAITGRASTEATERSDG